MRDHFFGVNVFFLLFCYRYLQEHLYRFTFRFYERFWLAFMWTLCVCVCVLWGGGFLFLLFFFYLFVCVHNFMFVRVFFFSCVYTLYVNGHSWVYIEILYLYVCVCFIENKSWRFYWRLNGIKSNSWLLFESNCIYFCLYPIYQILFILNRYKS